MTIVGLLHPGEMGSVVGGLARAGGARVLWASEHRSTATRKRAEAAALLDCGALEALVTEAEIILSICPPQAALEVARAVAARRFAGLYLDANAVAPGTARAVQAAIESGGGRFVDGGIVGPPPTAPGKTRLYLSGKAAPEVARLFAGSLLEVIVLQGPPGAASALKVAYAAYSKGTSALLMAIRALAIHEGVDAALVQEWERSAPDLPVRCDAAVRGTTRKAWRFVGEMEENAATFAAAGLPDGFSAAAADIYRRLSGYKDSQTLPGMREIAAVLQQRGKP